MKLVLANEEQKNHRDRLTFHEWGQALPNAEAFQLREVRLRAHRYSRQAMQTWMLTDDAGTVLSSCETFRMNSHLGTGSKETNQGSTYGFASVYTELCHRGRGYASEMMRQVVDRIRRDDSSTHSFILYSEVGAAIYERLGFVQCPSYDRVFPPLPENKSISKFAPKLLTHDTFTNPWNDLRPSHDLPFTVWPSALQLDWHFERERTYASLLDRSLPKFCGAMNEGGILLWAIDFKMEILRGLVLVSCSDNSLSTENVDALIAEAQLQATDLSLKEVRIWESDGFSGWDRMKQESERVHRDDGLAMILPATKNLKPQDWTFIPRALWV